MNKWEAVSTLEAPAGVIWITGFSAAGKTTVGRKVEAGLRAAGIPSIFLDGDDLRSILGDKWGYDRDQRIDLAKVYFRLCSHLSAQGHVVVISAVAMYKEVADWFQRNIPRNLQVYLKVPEAERRTRDADTKKIYTKDFNFSSLYDEPDSADLIIENFGGTRPEDSADAIIRFYRNSSHFDYDMGREKHWKSFYARSQAPAGASPFAQSVSEELRQPASIIEIGCGNGRDASYFARSGHAVTAVDLSKAAIEKCREHHASLSIDFHAGRLSELFPRPAEQFDVAYSRFVLHAMPLAEEIETLHTAYDILKTGGKFFIECRSINDPLARQGEVISPTERIHGHYRRFIVMDELKDRLRQVGFTISREIESKGLAVYGDEDPVVIRILAEKLVQ